MLLKFISGLCYFRHLFLIFDQSLPLPTEYISVLGKTLRLQLYDIELHLVLTFSTSVIFNLKFIYSYQFSKLQPTFSYL